MRRPRRLEVHPLTRLERGAPISFHHDGRRLKGFEGETLAAALYAAGRVTLSRSMRYHRSRGLFCATGGCTHCFLRVDGAPNQRSCQVFCQPTTWSEGQNALPNVEFDVLAGADLAFPNYLDAHAAFIRPPFLRPVYTRVIRAMAGFGRVPRAPLTQRFRLERESPDVLVVGAGAAGLAAAEAARAAGAEVTLMESEAQVGGRLRELPTPFHGVEQDGAPRSEGKEYSASALERLRRAGVIVRTGTRAFGVYERVWAAHSDVGLIESRPASVVLAVGSLDAYEPFPGSDRSGVMLASAALRLLNRHGIVPAEPVLIYGATRSGLLLARDLVACGARVRLYDPDGLPPASTKLLDDVRRLGVAIQPNQRALFVAGRKRPQAVVFEGPKGRRRAPCGTLVLAVGRVALGELFQQAGAELQPDAGGRGWFPRLGPDQRTTVAGLYAAGSCAGAPDEWTSVLQGLRAGEAAARAAKATPLPPPMEAAIA